MQRLRHAAAKAKACRHGRAAKAKEALGARNQSQGNPHGHVAEVKADLMGMHPRRRHAAAKAKARCGHAVKAKANGSQGLGIPMGT